MLRKLYEKIKNFDIKPQAPKGLDVLDNDARMLARRSKFSEAVAIYRKIVLLAPENSNALDKYIEHAFYDDVSETLKFTEILLEHYPDDIRLLALAGYASRTSYKALQYHSRIVRISPNSISANYFVKVLSDTPPKHPPLPYVKDLFNNYAEHFDHHLEKMLLYSAPEIMAKLLRKQHSRKIPFENALDACCGTGLFGKQLRIHFKVKHLTGIDLAENMIKQTHKKHIYNTLETCEVHEYLQNSKKHFNIISMIDSVNYIGDIANLVNLVHSNLTTNGLFCFTTEVSSKEKIIVDKTGRFSHSKKYIQELAKDKFTIMKLKKVSGRIERINSQYYYFVIFAKKSVSL